jgi:putative membrane protein insertion efficiency factor
MRKRRLIILSTVLLFQLSLTIDVFRQPGSQLSGKLYVAAVHAYQAVGRPLLEGRVACRFRPTCSDYSIAAVEKHGIIPGLVLTSKRLISCTNDVPMGTPDPVAEVVRH